VTSSGRSDRQHAEQRPWQQRRSFAERLFPGPSAPADRDEAERIRALVNAWKTRSTADPTAQPTAPAAPAAPTAPTDAGAPDAMAEQTELLRAILSSSLDTQSDARATAQNSRTFAWAGTAIALLTLIASVALVVEAVSGR
jgi:hypothetical protein